MNKARPFRFLALSLVFATTSCLDYEQETVLNADDSGTTTISYGVEARDTIAADSLLTLAPFNPDSLLAFFGAGVEDSLFVLDSIAAWREGTEARFYVKISFANIDTLLLAAPFKDLPITVVHSAPGQRKLEQFLPPEPSLFADFFSPDSNALLAPDTAYAVEAIFRLPELVVAHSAVEELSANELRWRYDETTLETGKTISITYGPYPPKGTPTWVYYATGFVLVLVGYYLLRKKK
ncbi:MAG: hypothetical protein GF419_02930 [Ignavibacteriales bacterium]|nr:hypothetical protein [Ignavibacteriales bacterium]